MFSYTHFTLSATLFLVIRYHLSVLFWLLHCGFSGHVRMNLPTMTNLGLKTSREWL